MQQTTETYGFSETALYRALRSLFRPKDLRRFDCKTTSMIAKAQMKHNCKLVVTVKVRTSNKKGRHLSTQQVIILQRDS